MSVTSLLAVRGRQTAHRSAGSFVETNMVHRISVLTRGRTASAKTLLVAFLVLGFTGASASQAWATLEIQSYNDPAGDPTPMSYMLLTAGQPSPGVSPNPFVLSEGERKSFGPLQGSYTWKGLPPAGWKVAAINCQRVDPRTGAPQAPRSGEFVIDLANGQVTVDHRTGEDQFCAFTNQKVAGSGSSPTGQGSSSGVSPTLPTSGAASLPVGTALLRVTTGRRFASASVRISRRSVIKAQLLKGKRVVGTARVTREAGTHAVKVFLNTKDRRRFQRQGLKRVTLTLKVVVVGSNGFTKVYRYGVVVRLT
jgi:hypothetical protein